MGGRQGTSSWDDSQGTECCRGRKGQDGESDCVGGDSFLQDRSLLAAPSSVGITAPSAAEPVQTLKADHGFPISKNEDLCLV